MNTREQFGNYLLLKKLSEDALGESFRAGRIGKGSVERVVLLRVFNGQSVDPNQLWSKVSARAALQGKLKSPNLGEGIDMGQVREVPYVAYDYVSGKNLADLLAQAARKRSPIPTDHALLITERVALGLAVAYETRMADSRVLHGFVVPQLIMLSNEGETRLLGLEVAPGLREFANRGPVATQVGRYLAPETLAGQGPNKADDVYSLAVILLELLTSQPAPTENAAAAVDRLELANEGTPIPTELATLLKRSLAPRAERIGDVVTWHKMLSKLMFDGQYNPTTFNLAFFMHNIFRDEIEKESQEIEVEKTIQIPVEAPKPAAPPRPAAAPAAAAGSAPATPAPTPATPSLNMEHLLGEEEKKGGKGLVIGIAAGLAAVAVVGFLMFGGKKKEETQAGSAAAAQYAAGAAQTAAPVPAGPTPEEIQKQIEQMVAEKMKSVETSVKAEQDKKLAELQKQLEDAKRAEQAAKAAAAARAAAPPPEPERRPAQAAAEPPRPTPTPATTTPAPTGGAPAQAAAAPPTAAPATASVTPPPAVVTPPPAPVVPEVKRGDLVEPGPGVKRPAVTSQATPRYPPVAERMRKTAVVIVHVLVDENGKVVQAQLAGSDPGYGFGDAALDAARRTRFSPAVKNGVAVKMWQDVKFAFKP